VARRSRLSRDSDDEEEEEEIDPVLIDGENLWFERLWLLVVVV